MMHPVLHKKQLNLKFKSMKKSAVVYFAVIISIIALPCFAQRTQKTITGEVVDQYNNLLNGDVVTLYDGATALGADTTKQGKFSITVNITGIDENKTQPESFMLSQNYPNPFNPTTTIEFSLDDLENVTLKIYNILGQEIKTLVDQELSPGGYGIVWGGDTDNGQGAAAGVYIYQLIAGNKKLAKKMILEDHGAGHSGTLQTRGAPSVRVAKTAGGNYHLIITGKDLLDSKNVPVDLSGNSPIDLGTLVVDKKPVVTFGAHHVYDLGTKYDDAGNRLIPQGIAGLHVFLQSNPANVATTDSTGNVTLRANHTGADSIFVVDTSGTFYSWKEAVDIGLDTNKVCAFNDTTGVPLFAQYVDQNGEDLRDFIVRMTGVKNATYPEYDKKYQHVYRRFEDSDVPIKIYMNRGQPEAKSWSADTALAGFEQAAGGHFQLQEVMDSTKASIIVDFNTNYDGLTITTLGTDSNGGPKVDHARILLGWWLYPDQMKAVAAHEIEQVIYGAGVYSLYESDVMWMDAITRLVDGYGTAPSTKELKSIRVLYDSERNMKPLNYYKWK